jgi:ribulose-phosphate 3-epimerase
MEVIPAINCEKEECVKMRFEIARSFSCEWLHIDVSDGVFANSHTWNHPETFLHAPAKLEVHLMVTNPEDVVEEWLKVGTKRIIVHAESFKNKKESVFLDMLALCKRFGAELVLSINPETKIETLFPYKDIVSSFQLLAVSPGLSGQEFDVAIISKIKMLREKIPGVIIEIDGGVNPIIAQQVADAGATRISVASYIFKSDNPAQAYTTLQQIS